MIQTKAPVQPAIEAYETLLALLLKAGIHPNGDRIHRPGLSDKTGVIGPAGQSWEFRIAEDGAIRLTRI